MARRLHRILHAKIISQPGVTVQGLLYYLQSQTTPLLVFYQTIILWIGTNNWRAPWDETATAYQQLLEHVAWAAPSAQVAVVSILPRPRDLGSSKRWVTSTKAWLRPACRRRKLHYFAASHLFIKKGIIQDLLYDDGLHLNQTGAKKMSDFLTTKTRALFP
jgi:lysophospholipase L1-like esterase